MVSDGKLDRNKTFSFPLMTSPIWMSFLKKDKYLNFVTPIQQNLKITTYSHNRWQQFREITKLFSRYEYSARAHAANDSLSSSCNDISRCWEIAPLNHQAET